MGHKWKAGILDDKSWHLQEQSTSKRYLGDYEDLVEVAREAGIYQVGVETLPTFVRVDGQEIETGEQQLVLTNTPWGDGIEVLKRSVSHYNPLDNKTLFDTFNSLSDTYNLAGVGMLGTRGQITFAQFKIPPYYIHGEEHLNRLLIGDDKEGGGTWYARTSTRVECWNTWKAAVRGIERIPHGADNATILRYLALLEEATIADQEREVEALNAFFTSRVPTGGVNKAVSSVFRMPRKSRKLKLIEQGKEYELETTQEIQEVVESEVSRYETARERADRRRQAVADEFFAMAADHPSGDSIYSLWNAFTYVVNHSGEFRGDTETAVYFGNRGPILDRAWEACEDLL